mmetsp:Transcript_32228/g.56582  ORF Transcript_32228/g.56582 Transcript_32228/m.56582 type:complete len:218 (+) Transcript_32228:35-688(+)
MSPLNIHKTQASSQSWGKRSRPSSLARHPLGCSGATWCGTRSESSCPGRNTHTRPSRSTSTMRTCTGQCASSTATTTWSLPSAPQAPSSRPPTVRAARVLSSTSRSMPGATRASGFSSWKTRRRSSAARLVRSGRPSPRARTTSAYSHTADCSWTSSLCPARSSVCAETTTCSRSSSRSTARCSTGCWTSTRTSSSTRVCFLCLRGPRSAGSGSPGT